MDASKDNSSWLRTLLKVFKHIPGAALMFAVVPLLVLGYLGWFYYGADHLDLALYSLRQENLVVTQQPEWIKSPVVEEVFENGGLKRISLLDPNATATIAQAFETHNWVKSTTRVTKSVGGKVEVDLIFRKPAAMVYYSPQTNQANAAPSSPNSQLPAGAQPQRGFYPVDADGIILPKQDFQADDIWHYFQLFAEGARPAGDIGMAFGDARISEALKLCLYLNDVREPLQLQEIWVHHDTNSAGPSPWIMTIVSRDKHQMLWGHAPELEAIGEQAAESKKSRLAAWLNMARAGSEPQQIDLRSTNPVAPVSSPRPIRQRP